MTQRFDIMLPPDMVDIIQRKIKSGAYATISDVVEDGLGALIERDAALERWLIGEVVTGHAEYMSEPSKGVPADDILDRIKARRGEVKAW